MRDKSNQKGIASILLGLILVFFIAAGAGVIYFKDQIPFLKDFLNKTSDNTQASTPKLVELDEVRIGLVAGLANSVVDRFYPFIEPDLPGVAITSSYLEPLVTFGKDLKVQPALAERWVSTDNTTWRFYLRQNVEFSDGKPFDAEDVKFTFDIINKLSQDGENSRYLQTIKDLKVVNPYEIEILTKEPDRSLLNKLAKIFILSRSSFKQETPKVAPVGTGPYILKEGKKDDYAILERNENYWGQKPYAKKVTYKVVSEDDQRVSEFLNNQLDLIEYVPGSKIDELKNNPKYKVDTIVAQAITYIGFDVRRDVTPYVSTPKNPFKDIRVRQAVYQAINMDDVNKNTFLNMAETQSQLSNRYNVGYNPNIKRLPYDLQKAKQLLAEAGYPNGFKVNIDVRHPRVGQYVTDVVRQLKDIGIEATVKVRRAGVTSAEDRARFAAGDTSMYSQNWTFEEGESLVTLTSLVHSRTSDNKYGDSNTGFYSNPKVDKLIEDAQSETNETKRLSYMQEAMKLAMDDMALIPLNSDLIGFAYDKNISWSPRVDQSIRPYEIAGISQ